MEPPKGNTAVIRIFRQRLSRKKTQQLPKNWRMLNSRITSPKLQSSTSPMKNHPEEAECGCSSSADQDVQNVRPAINPQSAAIAPGSARTARGSNRGSSAAAARALKPARRSRSSHTSVPATPAASPAELPRAEHAKSRIAVAFREATAIGADHQRHVPETRGSRPSAA